MSPRRRWTPQAEAEVFEHFRQLAQRRAAILISHRFRRCAMLIRLRCSSAAACWSWAATTSSWQAGGRYAELFQLQARGYR
jgi:ABC-type transport system involved in cytochrome bd biosynthesis fused ATPase/permease subunit